MSDDDIKTMKLNRMKKEILSIEKENLKGKEKINEEMIDEIVKIVISEANKKY